jgi:hypothetical protein
MVIISILAAASMSSIASLLKAIHSVQSTNRTSNIEEGILNVEGTQNKKLKKCRMITWIFKISCSTFCGSKYHGLGFVQCRLGIGDKVLVGQISLLHITRDAEKTLKKRWV